MSSFGRDSYNSRMRLYLAIAALVPLLVTVPASQRPEAQRIDEPYTSLIRQHLQDPRITTELVDHLPASDTVPSPLKFFGRAVGTPGELTLWYEGARRDNPEDEVVDDADLALYYREDQKHPWTPLAATQSITQHSFTYAIPHFSDYAVARLREWAVAW